MRCAIVLQSTKLSQLASCKATWSMASIASIAQAKHATLVCLAVKEMNELRFVLVPKRLRDEQFWAIYFTLMRGRLPPEAFDMLLQKQLEPPTVPKVRVL